MKRAVVILAVVSLSGCTLVGLGTGRFHARSANEDARERGEKNHTSVGASMAVGAGIGLLLDAALVGFVALSLSEGTFGH